MALGHWALECFPLNFLVSFCVPSSLYWALSKRYNRIYAVSPLLKLLWRDYHGIVKIIGMSWRHKYHWSPEQPNSKNVEVLLHVFHQKKLSGQIQLEDYSLLYSCQDLDIYVWKRGIDYCMTTLVSFPLHWKCFAVSFKLFCQSSSVVQENYIFSFAETTHVRRKLNKPLFQKTTCTLVLHIFRYNWSWRKRVLVRKVGTVSLVGEQILRRCWR
jgi:hypothetical protein